MGIAVAKLKQTRAERAPVLSRKSPASAPPAAKTKSAAKTELSASGRTKLAENYGKMVNAIFHFTKTHKISPSLKRRLENCAADLWDLEMEEDAKNGAMERSAFGKMARRALQNHKEGKTISLEEALKTRLR